MPDPRRRVAANVVSGGEAVDGAGDLFVRKSLVVESEDTIGVGENRSAS